MTKTGLERTPAIPGTPNPGAGSSGYARAALWMLGAIAGFSLVAIAGREASRGMSTLEVLLWRSWLSLLLLVVVFRPFIGGMAAFRSHAIGWHALRNAFHLLAQYGWFLALTMIPLAQLFALEFTAPLWIVLLAPLLIGERLTLPRFAAAAIGFAGAILAAKPTGMRIETGALYALGSAITFSISLILVKRIVRIDSVWTVLFNMAWMQGCVCLLLLLATTGLRMPPSGAVGWALVVAVTGTLAHFSLTRALTMADVILVAPLDFLRLPLIALVGAALYAEMLDPWIMLGGAIIVAANMLNLWAERRGRSR